MYKHRENGSKKERKLLSSRKFYSEEKKLYPMRNVHKSVPYCAVSHRLIHMPQFLRVWATAYTQHQITKFPPNNSNPVIHLLFYHWMQPGHKSTGWIGSLFEVTSLLEHFSDFLNLVLQSFEDANQLHFVPRSARPYVLIFSVKRLTMDAFAVNSKKIYGPSLARDSNYSYWLKQRVERPLRR